MSKPIVLNSIYEIIGQLIEYKKQHKQYPIGSFRLNPQGKIIPDPHGVIKVTEKKKKNMNNISSISSMEPSSISELPKKLTCSKCNKKFNASKDRIKKIAEKGELYTYLCRTCK